MTKGGSQGISPSIWRIHPEKAHLISNSHGRGARRGGPTAVLGASAPCAPCVGPPLPCVHVPGRRSLLGPFLLLLLLEVLLNVLEDALRGFSRDVLDGTA